MTTEEPSYLAFARANLRDNLPCSNLIVLGLVNHIDALTLRLKHAEEDVEAANSRISGRNCTCLNSGTCPACVEAWNRGRGTATSHVKWVNVSHDDKGHLQGYDVVRCTCEQPWRHLP